MSAFLDPIMPTTLYGAGEDLAAWSNELLRIHEQTGIRRFILAAPTHQVRVTGAVSTDVYRKIGRDLATVKKNLEPHGIDIGYNAMPTLKCGRGPYTHVKGIDGRVSEISACPLDTVFRHDFLEHLEEVARLAQPFVLMIEDDFQLSNHPGISFGCFCDLHLAEFARQAGRNYTREELLALFSEKSAESLRLRRLFASVVRHSLTGLAAELSERVAAVSPDTRLALSQPGCACKDADLTDELADALAGKHRPLVRYHGSSYSVDVPTSFPMLLFSCLYEREHHQGNNEFFHESDPCPHRTFYASAVRMEALMSMVLFYGFDNCLFWGAPTYVRGEEEDGAFLNMFRERHTRLEFLRDLGKQTEFAGPEIVWNSENVFRIPYGAQSGLDAAWPYLLGRFGIPYHTAGGNLKLVKGALPLEGMDDDAIEKLLSGKVMLDGEAAEYLTERGFSELIGVTARPASPVTFIRDIPGDLPELSDLAGFLTPSSFHQSYGNDNVSVASLTPLPGAEVVSKYLAPDGSFVSASVSRFANARGGRIGVLAPHLEGCQSSNIFSRVKRELLRRTFEWLAEEDLPAAVRDRSNVMLCARKTPSGDRVYLLIVPLSCDEWDSMTLAAARRYAGGPVRILDGDEWHSADVAWTGRDLTVRTRFRVYAPVLLELNEAKSNDK